MEQIKCDNRSLRLAKCLDRSLRLDSYVFLSEVAMSLEIGPVCLKNPYILAPMAGVSDLSFRLLCREMGAALVCMEMISAKAILYGNRHTWDLCETEPAEAPVSLQLFGSDPEVISEMAARIEERPFDLLDINMGCPVPKVVKNGEGSALMRNPGLAYEIVSQTVKKIRKPVTVKIRKGWNDREVNAVELAKAVEAAGASAIAVHGRTREQYYSGKADWGIIADVKNAVKIPVIGNGDVTGAASARAMMKETGCDFVMIGRAARGNPWIFRSILEDWPEDYLLPWEEVKTVVLRQAEKTVALRGEYTGIRQMRKHVAWYTAGRRCAAAMRREAGTIETLDDLRALLEKGEG
jgi:nifR3 family TIM-barrel protein